MEDLNTLKALRHEEPPVGCPPNASNTHSHVSMSQKIRVCC